MQAEDGPPRRPCGPPPGLAGSDAVLSQPPVTGSFTTQAVARVPGRGESSVPLPQAGTLLAVLAPQRPAADGRPLARRLPWTQ
jgi:hypothetical protein